MAPQWQQGRLKVRLVSGSNLGAAVQRPVVGLRLWKGHDMPTDREWVYSSVKHGRTPQWNEVFAFEVRNADQSLEVAVSNDSGPQGRQFVGQNFVYMAELEPNISLPFNMVLMGTEQTSPPSSLSLELHLATTPAKPPPSLPPPEPRPLEGTVPRPVWGPAAPPAFSPLGPAGRLLRAGPAAPPEIAYHARSDHRSFSHPQPQPSPLPGRPSLDGLQAVVDRLCVHSPAGSRSLSPFQPPYGAPAHLRSHSPPRGLSPHMHAEPIRYTSPQERWYPSAATVSPPGHYFNSLGGAMGPLYPAQPRGTPLWAIQPTPAPQIGWHATTALGPLADVTNRNDRRPFSPAAPRPSPPHHRGDDKPPRGGRRRSGPSKQGGRHRHADDDSDDSSLAPVQGWALVPYKASPTHHRDRRSKRSPPRRRSYSSSSSSCFSDSPPSDPSPPRRRGHRRSPKHRGHSDDDPTPVRGSKAKGAWAAGKPPRKTDPGRLRQRPPPSPSVEDNPPLPLAWVHRDWMDDVPIAPQGPVRRKQSRVAPAAQPLQSRQRPDPVRAGPRIEPVDSVTSTRTRPPPPFAQPDFSPDRRDWSKPPAQLPCYRSTSPRTGASGAPPGSTLTRREPLRPLSPGRRPPRPALVEVVVLGAKDMDASSGPASEVARELFARVRLGGDYQDTRSIRTFRTALWDQSFQFRLPDAGPFTMQVEVVDIARSTVVLGRCLVDLTMLPWHEAATHNLHEPLAGTRGSVSLMLHALSESDVRGWLQRAERWILDERRHAYRNAGPQQPHPPSAASLLKDPPPSRVSSVPLLMAPPGVRRKSDEETELEEYNPHSPDALPATGLLKFSLVVVRFLRGPKGFLDGRGPVHLKVAVHPLRSPAKRSAVATAPQPRAGVMTWTDPLTVGIPKGPLRVEVQLVAVVQGEPTAVGEGAFDLSGTAQPKRHRELKISSSVPGSSKRLQTEVQLEYSVLQ